MTNRASLGLMTYDIQYNDLLQSPWTSFPYRSYCAVKGKPSSWMFLEFRCATMCHVVQRGFTPHNFCTYQPCAWVAKETNLGRIPNRSSILYYIYNIRCSSSHPKNRLVYVGRHFSSPQDGCNPWNLISGVVNPSYKWTYNHSIP
jgi:hypothetical protein